MTKKRRQWAEVLDQQNLFRKPARGPNWASLAEDERTAVTSLLAQMIRERWARESREQLEVEHE